MQTWHLIPEKDHIKKLKTHARKTQLIGRCCTVTVLADISHTCAILMHMHAHILKVVYLAVVASNDA